MKTNVIQFAPGAAASDQAEPLESAVLEVSARVVENNAERRRLHCRLDELRASSPSLRRRRVRRPAVEPSRPVTFYSIEEAAEETAAPLQVA